MVSIEMVALTEILGGFSGFKARMLLFSGIAVLAGAVWTNGREMQRSGKVFKSPSVSAATTWSGDSSSGHKEFFLKKGDVWGKSAITLGLSFMIAMITGSILRAAFKTGIALLVLSGVAIWFLDRQGYVSLWDDYFKSVQQGGNWVTTNLGVIRQFLADHLPSAGSALVGFGFGLRR
jgi:uncharacterized membrane protein (Fun14 family)